MDNRILGIVGSVLVLLGLFLPVANVTATALNINQNFSFFDGIKSGSYGGLLLLILGIASLVLAVLRKYKFLILTGVLSLCLIVLNLVTVESSLTKGVGGGAEITSEMAQQVGLSISKQWLGWIILIIGSLLIIAAGAMKGKDVIPGTNYGAPTPPYPPAR